MSNSHIDYQEWRLFVHYFHMMRRCLLIKVASCFTQEWISSSRVFICLIHSILGIVCGDFFTPHCFRWFCSFLQDEFRLDLEFISDLSGVSTASDLSFLLTFNFYTCLEVGKPNIFLYCYLELWLSTFWRDRSSIVGRLSWDWEIFKCKKCLVNDGGFANLGCWIMRL